MIWIDPETAKQTKFCQLLYGGPHEPLSIRASDEELGRLKLAVRDMVNNYRSQYRVIPDGSHWFFSVINKIVAIMEEVNKEASS